MQCKRCHERPAAGIRGLCDPCHVSGGCAGVGWDEARGSSPYPEGWHPEQKPRTKARPKPKR